MENIVLAGGCFWCLDASFRLVNGVETVVSGFAGGLEVNPAYEEVAYGQTGHSEAVSIIFNPSVVTLEDILDIFWVLHDPTTLNRQGNDVGPQYRSAIFYANEAQKTIVKASQAKAQKVWPDKIVTEIKPLDVFYPAENYHQDFFNKNPELSYCQVIINPKLTKLREKFTKHLKT